MNFKPSIEDRMWAATSHLSTLTMGLGLFVPVVGWSECRRRSNYASFQCLQSLGYQTLGYTIWILLALVLVVIGAIRWIAGMNTIRAMESSLSTPLTGDSNLMMGLLLGLYFLPPILASVACAFGMEFRYPVLGSRLARYLGYEPLRSNGESWPLIEEHEDRWVASAGHFSVIVMLWGLMVPIFAWILQGKRSLFLRFQSMQTVVYQAGVTLLYVVAGFLYVFGFAAFILTIGFEGDINLSSSSSLIGTVIFLLSLFVAVFIIMIVPLFHILGQWAGYRLLKGIDYRYPLAGKVAERWIQKNSITEEKKPL